MKLLNLPVFNELKLDLNNPDKIYQDLKESRAGKSPCFIKMLEITEDKLQFHLTIILKQLEQLNIDPKIPYPIYIISEHRIEHPFFSIVGSEEGLPHYYKIRVKQPGAKESALIQKIEILSEKIRNFLDEDKKTDMEKFSSYSRQVFNLKRQEIFWEELSVASEKISE